MQLRVSLEFFVLTAAIVAEAIVLYLVEEPSTRLILGATLLALVVWSSARVGVIELLPGGPTRMFNRRRFVHLRSKVAQLLDEIRRLNWVAVDAERGFRSREEAIAEMDRTEERLRELIEEIRGVAGVMSEEAEELGVASGEGALT